MDNITEEEKLQATFPYLDNITLCGKDQNEHDVNLKHFWKQLLDLRLCITIASIFFPLENWRFLVPSLRKRRSGQILSVCTLSGNYLFLVIGRVSTDMLDSFLIIVNGSDASLRRYDPLQLPLVSQYLRRLRLLLKH